MKHSVTQKVWPGEVELYRGLNKSQAVVSSVRHLIYCLDLQQPNENVGHDAGVCLRVDVKGGSFFFALVAPHDLAYFRMQADPWETWHWN